MKNFRNLTKGTYLEDGCGIVKLTSDYIPEKHGYEYIDCDVNDDGDVIIPDNAGTGLLDLIDVARRVII